MSLATASPSTFRDLGLSQPLCEALSRVGVTSPFPIQIATLPDSLSGRDVLGRGRTGSGKTYAFALPLLDRLAARRTKPQPGRPRALVLAPTRELATQIDAAMRPLARAVGLRTVTVFGGVAPGPQISALRRGVDVVVACPGRLADHMQSGHVSLASVEVTVVDEADHMADLGFLPVVRRLLDATPKTGQRMLFSATLDGAVDVLVKRFMRSPVTHSVDSVQSPVAAMDHHVLHVTAGDRLPVLVDLTSAPGRTLVFTRTKHGAKTLARKLTAAGVPSVELHGNLSQGARSRNLAAFSDGRAPTLVATDIAARGIHVDDIGLVVHADPPLEHKAYLHRSGRTARAGAAGTVVTLVTDAQARDVRTLTRKAGISATTTRLDASHPLLEQIAPGARALVAPSRSAAPAPEQGSGGRSGGSRSRPGSGSSRRTSSGRSSRSNAGRGTASTGDHAARTGGSRGSRSTPATGTGRGSASSSRSASAFSAGVRTSGRR
jgi:superfamily II DNA/RNA helicase